MVGGGKEGTEVRGFVHHGRQGVAGGSYGMRMQMQMRMRMRMRMRARAKVEELPSPRPTHPLA